MSIKLAWQQIPSMVISDILCQNNLDGVVLDTEHGCYSNETLYNCIQLITANNKKCFVRLTEVNKTMIRFCLDANVDGLIFSTVESLIQTMDIHKLCKFPKYGGRRGLGLVKQNKWGKEELISKPPILIAQIETIYGVNALEKIQNYGFDYPYSSPTFGGWGGIIIDEQSPQTWFNFETGDIYYYPVRDIKNQIKKYSEYGIIALGMDTIALMEGYDDISDSSD